MSTTGRHPGGLFPLPAIQRLGHASVVITLDAYSHVLPEMDEQAIAAMQRILAV